MAHNPLASVNNQPVVLFTAQSVLQSNVQVFNLGMTVEFTNGYKHLVSSNGLKISYKMGEFVVCWTQLSMVQELQSTSFEFNYLVRDSRVVPLAWNKNTM